MSAVIVSAGGAIFGILLTVLVLLLVWRDVKNEPELMAEPLDCEPCRRLDESIPHLNHAVEGCEFCKQQFGSAEDEPPIRHGNWPTHGSE